MRPQATAQDETMRCLRCILLFTAVCLVIAALAGLLTVLFVADWLVHSDELRPADRIVVLAGAPERALYAGDLYVKQYAPIVLVSRPAPHPSQPLLSEYGIALQQEEDINRELLRAKHVPDTAIEMFGRGSLSTVDEMDALKTRFARQPVRLLIVTSPLHTRRARLAARAAFDGTDIVASVVATPYESLPRRWWAEQYTARSVILEVMKTVFWLLGGQFRST